jgi:hypothetical protein
VNEIDVCNKHMHDSYPSILTIKKRKELKWYFSKKNDMFSSNSLVLFFLALKERRKKKSENKSKPNREEVESRLMR